MMRHKHRALGSLTSFTSLITWQTDPSAGLLLTQTLNTPVAVTTNNFLLFSTLLGYFAISQVHLCAKFLIFKVRVLRKVTIFLVTQLKVWVFSWQAVALREGGTAGKGKTKS